MPSTRHPKTSRALYGRKVEHNLNVCVDRERVAVGEDGFHAADFDVRMSGIGKEPGRSPCWILW